MYKVKTSVEFDAMQFTNLKMEDIKFVPFLDVKPWTQNLPKSQQHPPFLFTFKYSTAVHAELEIINSKWH